MSRTDNGVRRIRGPDWSWTTPAGKRRAKRRAERIGYGARIFPVVNLGTSVLEIGCGVGTFTEFFKCPRIRLAAIDKSIEMVKIARERVSGVIIIQCDLGQLHPIILRDAVVGSSVLHHIDIQKGLSKVYTLLKPGGRLSFAEPNLLNPQVWIERKFPSLFWYVSPQETAFSRWFIKRELERAGFVDVKVSPFDWLHPLTPKMLVPLVDRLGRILERIPGVREFAGSLWIRGRKPI